MQHVGSRQYFLFDCHGSLLIPQSLRSESLHRLRSTVNDPSLAGFVLGVSESRWYSICYVVMGVQNHLAFKELQEGVLEGDIVPQYRLIRLGSKRRRITDWGTSKAYNAQILGAPRVHSRYKSSTRLGWQTELGNSVAVRARRVRMVVIACTD
ncbi:hypothetical protein EI94DRAFT_1738973 [Lactarius quietus]|nr:hypothetical protein EI94DRAFT_1738973 [Lactarius quietus]